MERLKNLKQKYPVVVIAIATAAAVFGIYKMGDVLEGGSEAGAAKKKKANVPDLRKLLEETDAKLGDHEMSLPKMSQAHGGGKDRSLSPYFYVAGGDPDTDTLPLKETSARVNVAGVIASVQVRQVYGNNGKEPIEAVYVFPASTRAAVHGMKMKIGERIIDAKIDERKAAEETYEAAKSEGKKASLLEQERPNVFTMRVANIMPGDTIEVILEYSELLTHEKGTYEFVYPTVVGPRYGPGADQATDEWIENPYLHEGNKETYAFDIEVHMQTGVPVQDVRSPSHSLDLKYHSPSSARIGLKEKGGGNKDFVLEYRLAGDKIESEVLLYEHEDESFFVLLMQPPHAPGPKDTLPREYIFLLDVSGSMSGFPLDTAKALMGDLLDDLGPDDYFNIVTFAGASHVMSEKSLPVTAATRSKAHALLGSLYGGGGTELMDGLRKAYSVPRVEDKTVSRSVVVVTDGYVGVEAGAFKLIRDRLSEANLFAFGIGSSVNRYLIEGMARAGYGEPFVVLDPSKSAGAAVRFRQYIERPVLTDIEVEFDGFDVHDEAPVSVPDLMAERPLVVFGKYRGEPGGHILVKGRAADHKYEKKIEIEDESVSDRNVPLRALWVRKWVALLGDQLCMLPGEKELEEAITRLGLHYSLLTRFTSFVAVDKVKTNKKGKPKTVKQPLPLPEGVSDLAVGGQVKHEQASLAIQYKNKHSSGDDLMALLAGATKGKKASKAKKKKGSYKSAKPPASSAGPSLKQVLPKEVKSAVKDSKAVQKAREKCSCDTVMVRVKVKFGPGGKLSLLVVTPHESSKECDGIGAVLAAVKKAIEKHFKGKKLSGASGKSAVLPLII